MFSYMAKINNYIYIEGDVFTFVILKASWMLREMNRFDF